MPPEFYSFSCQERDGSEFQFSRLRGKVVLVVNVASKCGFRKQYGELQRLYEDYKDQGFEILGFPCNQFINQEPGTDEEIGKFCQDYYGVTFKVFKKVKVNGQNAIPTYQYLKQKKPGRFGVKFIRWNFEKFLIDRSGHVFGRYFTLTRPDSLREDIEVLLRARKQ